MPTTITQDQMNHLYNDINPTPHSEKAYMVPRDPSPPIAPKKTIADSRGKVTVLVTCLYNRDGQAGVRYGSVAEYAIHTSANGAEIRRGSGTIPFKDELALDPGGYYWVQPLTPNTQAKLLPANLAV